jgi:hypothetical protein
MKTETKTDNELIARFMGGVSQKATSYSIHDYPNELPSHILKDLKYHKSWDWLMPVVEKIETLKFSVMVIGKYTRIQCPHPYKEFATDICENKIQSVYKAVVEFIKWYNQQKP